MQRQCFNFFRNWYTLFEENDTHFTMCSFSTKHFIDSSIFYKDESEEPSIKKKKRSPTKKKQSSSGVKTPKQSTRKKKAVSMKPKRRTGLIPNPDIKLLDEDPTYTKDSKIPLSLERQVIKAVLSKDQALLKKLRNDVKNVYTLNQVRSPHISKTSAEYAIIKEDFELYKLIQRKRDKVTATRKVYDLQMKNTGQ